MFPQTCECESTDLMVSSIHFHSHRGRDFAGMSQCQSKQWYDLPLTAMVRIPFIRGFMNGSLLIKPSSREAERRHNLSLKLSGNCQVQNHIYQFVHQCLGVNRAFINNCSANTVILFAASLNILPPVYISSKTDSNLCPLDRRLFEIHL